MTDEKRSTILLLYTNNSRGVACINYTITMAMCLDGTQLYLIILILLHSLIPRNYQTTIMIS
jgi:hypothetical protein